MSRWLLTAVVLVMCTGFANAAPVPKAMKKAKPLRTKIAPLAGEEVYSVDWEGVPFNRVAEELERKTGLLFLSKDVPKVNITLRAHDVCLWELFALLDDTLTRRDRSRYRRHTVVRRLRGGIPPPPS